MAAHSSTLAWKIPWMEEPGRLQSMGSLRVGHAWATSLSLFTFLHWRRKWQPTPVFLPGESQGRGAWWVAVYGVAQSRTRLKRLSSSSSSHSLNAQQSQFTDTSLWRKVWHLLQAPSKEYRQLILKRLELLNGFQGGVFKDSLRERVVGVCISSGSVL